VRERDKLTGHAFISYVHEDSRQVDRLQRMLQAAGVSVWRDTADLWPGEDWRMEIRHAITNNALVFIACFSQASLARDKSYQNEELTLAIEQLRLRRPNEPWLVPVRFDECDIPDRDIGGGRALASIQRADLFGEHFDEGVRRLAGTVSRILSKNAPEAPTGPEGSPKLLEPRQTEAARDMRRTGTADLDASVINATLPGAERPQSGFAMTIPAAHTRWISCLTFSPDGAMLASGGQDCRIRLWDVRTCENVPRRIRMLPMVYSVAFSPDGATLATGGRDSRIRLFDIDSGKKKRTLVCRPITSFFGNIAAVAFSPDGLLLASTGSGGIRLWDVGTGRHTTTFSGHAVAFSPDGTTLASGGPHGTVQLWDVKTGQSIASLTGHTKAVTSVVFSPDGALLASGGDRTVRVWEVGTNSNVFTFSSIIGNGFLSRVRSIAFSPNGKTLAGSGGKNIYLWDVESGRNIATLKGHTDVVQSIAFSPKGSLLASAGGDRTIRLWKV
jgi:hypothetical protein